MRAMMAGVLAVVLVIAFVLCVTAMAAAQAWVMAQLWWWYAVPLGAPVIAWHYMLGMLVLLKMMIPLPKPEDVSPWTQFADWFMRVVGALFFGWLFRFLFQ